MTSTPTSSLAVDVDAVLDQARFRGVSLIAVICTLSVLVLDGFDIQVMGVTAPAVAAEFDMRREELGPVLAASLIGMALGSFFIGPVGDRWGRRPALLGSALLFGLATLLSATADSAAILATYRFVTGLGLGGALPNAAALIAEYAPPRWRTVAITTAFVGAPLGGMLGAAVAAEVVPILGWRWMFVVGGLLPIIAAGPLYVFLPESARFLTIRSGHNSRLAALLNRIEGRLRYSSADTFVCENRTLASGGIGALFSPELARDTCATWLVFGATMFVLYAFANWIPAVLASVGFGLSTAIRGALVFNLAGVIGALANAWAMSKLGSRLPLGVLAAIAIVALLFLAWAAAIADPAQPRSGSGPVLLAVAVAGFGITAMQLGMYAVAAHIYPVQCRSTGLGWAVGAGRSGGIASSFVGGVLLAQGGGSGFFVGIASVVAVALAGLLLAGGHISVAESSTHGRPHSSRN